MATRTATFRRPSPAVLGVLTCAAALLLCLGAAPSQPDSGKTRRDPLTPEQARAAFRVAPGLRVELVAAEPAIESPVALSFDEDGRLWVVEMRDYPNGPAPGQPPAGRIRLLEDRDGDGFYEHSTVFADRLLFANGLLPWRGGLVVTAAPHVVYLRDGKREVLYEGFAAENPQLRVSHPNLGLDNWVYVANGLRGGKVRRAGRPGSPVVNLGGRDFHFDLVHDRYEAISGMGQYGNTFDDWGHRFVCDNQHHLRHVVLPERYLKRNPYLAVSQVLEDTSELPLGAAGAGAKIYPLSKNWTTSNLHAGRFTAACSVFIYRGDLLPEEFRGAAFTCDPTGNLVHEEVLRQSGATFRSRPPRQGVEFLATPDDWCRPVFLTLGPDGAMYVIDMCRAVIEHPEFMPPELQKRADLTWGKDRGRIWRIVPEGYQGKPARPHLSKAGVPELVKLLEHPSAWWRTTAQRLLLERQDRAAVPPLRELVASGKQPRGRLHAAWLLESFGSLDEALVLKLLADQHPRVREQAVLLSERWLPKSADVQKRVAALASDPDSQVRFQVALSLGEWDSDAILEPLAKIALAGDADHWTREAVLSSVGRRAYALLFDHLSKRDGFDAAGNTAHARLLEELSVQVGARAARDEVASFLTEIGADPTSGARAPLHWDVVITGWNGLAEGLSRSGKSLTGFLESISQDNKLAGRGLTSRFDVVAKIAQQKFADPSKHKPFDSRVRLGAIRLLAHAPWQTAGPTLTHLLTDDPAQEVRLAAVRSLAAHSRPEVAGILLKSWRSYLPAVRREVTEALLRQPDRVRALLAEVEAGHVKAGDIDAVRVRQLLSYGQPEIRERARKLLRAGLPADRKQVLARYQAALTRQGDPIKGREVFKKNCSTCHRVAGLGVDVGPDISDSRTKTAAALLTDILNPNQAIDNNYINYVVSTKGGKVLTGIIATETATSLTLRRAEGQTDVVLRQDIEEVVSSGVSLMPEGLEKEISVEQMADLLAFLKGWRYLHGEVPTAGAAAP
jgi:putative membrane-bound dehydrogenase-like protein